MPVCLTPIARPLRERGNHDVIALEPPGVELDAPKLASRKRTNSHQNPLAPAAMRTSRAIVATPEVTTTRSPRRSIRMPIKSVVIAMPPRRAAERSPSWARPMPRSPARTGPRAAGACWSIETEA